METEIERNIFRSIRPETYTLPIDKLEQPKMYIIRIANYREIGYNMKE